MGKLRQYSTNREKLEREDKPGTRKNKYLQERTGPLSNRD